MPDQEEPAFLKRLRGDFGESSDRHTHPIARPKRARQNNGEDDDDGPTYVDATTNETLSRAELSELQNPASNQDTGKTEPAKDDANADVTGKALSESVELRKEETGQIGGTAKRRVARVVADSDKHDAAEPAGEKKGKKTDRASGKKKKVKLSFDED